MTLPSGYDSSGPVPNHSASLRSPGSWRCTPSHARRIRQQFAGLILAKLDLAHRTEAIVKAREAGLGRGRNPIYGDEGV
jgi:hypothetical protein